MEIATELKPEEHLDSGGRKCTRCNCYKSLNEFAGVAKKTQSWCKGCFNSYARGRHMEAETPHRKNQRRLSKAQRRFRNREFLFNYIRYQKCTDCGIDDFRVFELDHRDPTTKHRNICDFINFAHSIRLLVEEIRKCDLVCVNCHRLRTYSRLGDKNQLTPTGVIL